MNKIDVYCNVVVAQGRVGALSDLARKLHDHFKQVTEQPPEEAARHRDWIAGEIGGFTTAPHHPIRSWYFETESTRVATRTPDQQRVLTPLIATARSRSFTIGYIGIDMQQAPRAVAAAISSDADRGIVGSIGGNRDNYCRVLQHMFYNDSADELKHGLSDDDGICAVLTNRHVQWSDANSPLHFLFRTDDPLRKDLSLSLESLDTTGPRIVRGGSRPAEGNSLVVPMGWQEAYALFERASDCGVGPHFTHDMILAVSGYGLFNAGVIDECLNVVPQYHSGVQHSKETTIDEARAKLMGLYVLMLQSVLSVEDKATRAYRVADNHLQRALKWLSDNKIVIRVKGDVAGNASNN
jgi:hypothetical protein